MDHCVYFSASIELKFIGDLMNNLVEQIGKGVNKFHIVISSTGGNPRQAIGAYNFLRSITAEVSTYNLSQVDSAAVPMFLAGAERIMAPYSSMTVHRPKMIRKVDFTQDESDACRETLRTLRRDHADMADIFAAKTSLTKRKALAMLREGKVLTPVDALDLGFVTKIELPVFSEMSASVIRPPQSA